MNKMEEAGLRKLMMNESLDLLTWRSQWNTQRFQLAFRYVGPDNMDLAGLETHILEVFSPQKQLKPGG